jgi:broad specificity phosphatase PhoE
VRLILVSHGEADDKGALTDLGIRQTQALASEVAAISARTSAVDTIYSSAAPASWELAKLIASRLGELMPIAYGNSTAANGQEPPQDGWAALEALRDEHEDNAMLVLVTDENTIRSLVCSALTIPPSEAHRFRIDPASLTTLEFRTQPQRRTILAGLNETCHLTAE